MNPSAIRATPVIEKKISGFSYWCSYNYYTHCVKETIKLRNSC